MNDSRNTQNATSSELEEQLLDDELRNVVGGIGRAVFNPAKRVAAQHSALISAPQKKIGTWKEEGKIAIIWIFKLNVSLIDSIQIECLIDWFASNTARPINLLKISFIPRHHSPSFIPKAIGVRLSIPTEKFLAALRENCRRIGGELTENWSKRCFFQHIHSRFLYREIMCISVSTQIHTCVNTIMNYPFEACWWAVTPTEQ